MTTRETYMKYKLLFVGLIGMACSAPLLAAANIYQCISGGRTTFTSTPRPGCTVFDASRSPMSVIDAPVRNTNNADAQAGQDTAPVQDSARIAQAQRELQDAQRALEEGKKIRLGGEANFVRFQERIQGLQDVVDAKQKQLNELMTQ